MEAQKKLHNMVRAVEYSLHIKNHVSSLYDCIDMLESVWATPGKIAEV